LSRRRRSHMHLYKVSGVQEIFPRIAQFKKKKLNDDDVLDLSFFTDESDFHLGGYVYKQNYRQWSVVNPQFA
jgi:hypothetical protein